MNPVNQEATQFIYNVKERFRNQPSKFNEFAQVVSDISTWIRLGRNCDNLVYKLKDMFDNDDHRDLIFGLNQFLADRYQPSALKLQQNDDDAMFEKDGRPFKLMPHDEFFYRIYDRCVEKNDVDFNVLTKFSDTIISYQVRKIDFHEADKIFRDIFRDDPDLYVESTHVMSSRVVEKDSSGSSVSVLDFLKRGGKKQSILVEKKWSLYEEVMMLKEYNLYELDIWLGPMGSLAEKLENSPEKLEAALTANDIRMIKTIYSAGLEVGEEMVERLQSDGVGYMKARDVLLSRLRQKLQLEEMKPQLEKLWSEIFQDIQEKGKVCRHSGFVEDMKKLSGD